MIDQSFKYVIVGAGLAGASAVEGIRQHDADGSVLLIGREPWLPYNRPPFSKKLWFGGERLEEVFVHDHTFYTERHVTLALGVEVVDIDPSAHEVADSLGGRYRYEKLLLATGGEPRQLTIPGGDLPEVCYYRTANDFCRLRKELGGGKAVTVIGGGFIGSEMAASLTQAHVQVTIIFPGPTLCARVFPDSLGRATANLFRDRGIDVLAGDAVLAIEKRGDKLLAHTRSGRSIESDHIVAGIGITPATKLADLAGLTQRNGIVVNELLQSSDPAIYAAGDNALFPYAALGQAARVEHWDNALNQGRAAGANMAGAGQPYTYMPFFFSDLFEFGYEAVGEVDSRLETQADWQEENKTGVIYYLRDGVIRGAMMCNVWGKVDEARQLIQARRKLALAELHGAIH